MEGRGHRRGEDDDDDDQEDDYDDYGGASDMEVRKHCRSYPQFFLKWFNVKVFSSSLYRYQI